MSIEKSIIINGDIMVDVLEAAKILKSEYVIIPRVLMQSSDRSSILGISYNSIVTTSHFYSLEDPKYYNLWDGTSDVEYIVVATKDINPFLRDVTGYKAFHENYDKNYMSINYTLHNNGMKNIGIAHSLTNIYLKNAIPLFQYHDLLFKIDGMIFGKNNGSIVIPRTDLRSNQEFLDIIHSKAGVGAQIWIPEMANSEKLYQYAMSLTGTLLNVSKGDYIEYRIYDKIPNHSGYNFITEFIVNKPKKRCGLLYFMMFLKIV